MYREFLVVDAAETLRQSYLSSKTTVRVGGAYCSIHPLHNNQIILLIFRHLKPSVPHKFDDNTTLLFHIYNNWNGHRHNEVLVNLDHTMILGFFAPREQQNKLEFLQEQFFEKYGDHVDIFYKDGNGDFTQFE